MSRLRIGYINVRGLMSDKWRASLALLDSGSCDLLFVAETWYVGHDFYSLDRHFITSTTQGRDAKVAAAKGRPSGGMYLLGTAEARGRIHGVPGFVGESSITVSIDTDRFMVSGVYLPPSMTPADVQTVLDGLSESSSVVLGDINTRFRDKVYQQGAPGPPDRLAVFTDFLSQQRVDPFFRLKPSLPLPPSLLSSPSSLSPLPPPLSTSPPAAFVDNQAETSSTSMFQTRLTTDHCFVKGRHRRRCTLRLFDNKNHTRIRTDHLYTLHLVVGSVKSRRGLDGLSVGVDEKNDIPRYKISNLAKDDALLKITKNFETLHSSSAIEAVADVDEINTRLVTLCQKICRSVLGQVNNRSKKSADSNVTSSDDGNRERTRKRRARGDVEVETGEVGDDTTTAATITTTSITVAATTSITVATTTATTTAATTPATSSITIGSAKPTLLTPEDDQSFENSVRLYKKAAIISKENDVIIPTERAKATNVTALNENLISLKGRYTSSKRLSLPSKPPSCFAAVTGTTAVLQQFTSHALPYAHPYLPSPFTIDQITLEIMRQDASKSCGADGLHIRFLKALVDCPAFLQSLHHLYAQCLSSTRTPAAWNETEIHLLIKDTAKPRDANNLRPITLICMFRKVFERLLLSRFDHDGWAKIHPAQAGFRSHYSTYTNAAMVHHALSTGLRKIAVFLDFKSAFDVLDHSILERVLVERGCPSYLLALIKSLTFDNVRSRVLVNGEASDWFRRTCGVLQGSPISPHLFNFFVDGLITELNIDYSHLGKDPIPYTLFYADDGTLLPTDYDEARRLLQIVERWSDVNGLRLNVRKCGHMSQYLIPQALFLDHGTEQIPLVQQYDYLGFPMTARGIDFEAHLTRRIGAAVARANFLSISSDSWGPAHRLRVFKRYLAPMFEYGAPLVVAWADSYSLNATKFRACLAKIQDLIFWITNSKSSYRIAMNICGLPLPESRFRLLRTSFQRILNESPVQNPLKRIISMPRSRLFSSAFAYALSYDFGWNAFVVQNKIDPTARPQTFKQYLRRKLSSIVLEEAGRKHLTKVIAPESRKVPGLFMADISLAAPISKQDNLFRYRQGSFMFGFRCKCNPDRSFRRGHESCSLLPHLSRLTKAEREQKRELTERLEGSGLVTDVDILLNNRQLDRAAEVLMSAKAALGRVYRNGRLAEVAAAAAAAETAAAPVDADGDIIMTAGPE